jgi:transposase InsO family protein
MRGVAYSLAERELLMKMHQQGKSLSMLSRDTGIASPVLSRWWMRYQQQGRAGLEPRSRRPRRSPYRLAAGVQSEVLQLRERGWGPARIALALGIGHSSVHRVLVRHGHNRLRWPEQKTFRRYEKSRPGELVHVDLKYLYRWKNTQREYAFAAVDDFSREAVAQIRPARTSGDAAAFLERLVAALPYRIEAVMTDNDFIFTMRYACHSERQTRFQQACRSLGIEHWRARPRHPQSNGKVERFFRTLDEECFAVHRPRSSRTRMRVLEDFLQYYNHQRPHLSLHGLTPVERRRAYFQQAQL